MLRLLILRHAKSSWADGPADDWERPLNDRGERDAPRVGTLLRQLSLLPDLIVTSDAVRAETTARAVAGAAEYLGKIVLAPELYHASPDAIIDVIRAFPETARSVMVVAHNPGLQDLVVQLTGESVELQTATLVHVELPVEHWREVTLSQRADLVDIWRPGDM
jgi:phosphohistidine phosphatase